MELKLKTLRAVSQNTNLFVEWCQLRQQLIMAAEEKTWQIWNDISCIFKVRDGIKSTEFQNIFCTRTVKSFFCIFFF